MAFPPYKYDPPLETPPVGGLLTVANVVTVPPPARILGGVEVRDSIDMSPFPQTFTKVGVCWEGENPTAPGPGLFPYGATVFDPYLYETPVQCDPTITDEELTAAATHVHEIRKPSVVESAVYGQILPGLNPTAAMSVAVEQTLAVADHQSASGYGTRVVHLSALWATYLLGKGVIVKSGSIYRTAMGNPIAFVGDGLGLTDAYITSAMTILQTAQDTDTVLDHQRNDRYVKTSQIIVPVLHSELSTRVAITTTPSFPDGNAGGGAGPETYALLPGFTPGTEAVPGTSSE